LKVNQCLKIHYFNIIFESHKYFIIINNIYITFNSKYFKFINFSFIFGFNKHSSKLSGLKKYKLNILRIKKKKLQSISHSENFKLIFKIYDSVSIKKI